MLAHKTSMEIPIANVINLNKYNFIINKNDLIMLN